MKKKQGKAVPFGKTSACPGRSANRQLVLLDQAGLRRKAASECSREMARLEKAKSEWKRFEVEDQAAYARWMAATFGPLLSRVRDAEAALRERQALVQEIDFEMYMSGTRSPRVAYARVQQRRNSPPPEPARRQDPPPPEPPPGARSGGENFSEEFDEDENAPNMAEILMFETYLMFELGLDPYSLSDAKYARMFADFRANVLGGERPRPEPRRPAPQAPEPRQPEQDRVKELYRVLVRRLHPDLRADRDAAVSALWHEVQEAYAQGNVERLEMLLALTDMQANTIGEHTTLFQMRAVLAELRRSWRALQKNLREAKRSPAWNFTRRTDRSPLEMRLRRELESALWNAETELRSLDALIADWSKPAAPRKKKSRRAEPAHARPFRAAQADFSF